MTLPVKVAEQADAFAQLVGVGAGHCDDLLLLKCPARILNFFITFSRFFGGAGQEGWWAEIGVRGFSRHFAAVGGFCRAWRHVRRGSAKCVRVKI